MAVNESLCDNIDLLILLEHGIGAHEKHVLVQFIIRRYWESERMNLSIHRQAHATRKSSEFVSQ